MLHLGLSYDAFACALLSIAVRRYCAVDAPSAADTGAAAAEALDVGDVVPASAVTHDVALRLLLLHQVCVRVRTAPTFLCPEYVLILFVFAT
jgi:hypothetical protein